MLINRKERLFYLAFAFSFFIILKSFVKVLIVITIFVLFCVYIVFGYPISSTYNYLLAIKIGSNTRINILIMMLKIIVLMFMLILLCSELLL